MIIFQTPLGPIGGLSLKPALPPLKKISPLGSVAPLGSQNGPGTLKPLQKTKLGALEPKLETNLEIKSKKSGELKSNGTFREVKKVSLIDDLSESLSRDDIGARYKSREEISNVEISDDDINIGDESEDESNASSEFPR